MNRAVKMTLEGILAGALLLSSGACTQPPANTTTQTAQQQPTITTPYTIQGQFASLDYVGEGKNRKLVVVDVDKIGHQLFDVSGTFPARNILKFKDYSVIIGGVDFAFAAFYNSTAQKDSNSESLEPIGTVSNLGKFEGLTISGDYVIIGLDTSYNDDSNRESKSILNAVSQVLKYKDMNDRGQNDNNTPVVNVGSMTMDPPTPRGPNTDYVARVGLYKLKPASAGLKELEKIASQPLVLLRNSQIEEMTLGQDSNGAATITVKYSWEDNSGTRVDNTGAFKLDALTSSGIATEANVKPLLAR